VKDTNKYKKILDSGSTIHLVSSDKDLPKVMSFPCCGIDFGIPNDIHHKYLSMHPYKEKFFTVPLVELIYKGQIMGVEVYFMSQ